MRTMIQCNLACVTLSSSVWFKEGLLGMDVGDEDLLFLAEAMLINYFKPEYNTHYVTKNPSTSHTVYAELRNAGVKNLQLNLNLFMQIYKNILSIKTPTINTNRAKHISLHSTLENMEKYPQNNIISAEVMPEELYPFFIGE